MKKSKEYHFIKFNAEVIKIAATLFLDLAKSRNRLKYLIVNLGHEKWEYDTEDEFFSDYRNCDSAIYKLIDVNYKENFEIYFKGNQTEIEVTLPNRADILKIFEIFEQHVNESRLPEPPPAPKPKPRIFIGHGQNPQWRDLKDHLHDKHDFQIEAYETGARAGHTIRDIISIMASNNNFALLVMTAEDETADGKMRARQNVIHEIGLFQGRLGFHRAIVLLEKGTEEFSNIHGIDQIRFSKGNIKETFGDVLATLKREFPQ